MDRRELGAEAVDTAQEKKERPKITDEERRRRFHDLIEPNFEFIRNLVSYYTDYRQNVDENYNTLLIDFYRYIHTYNGDKPLKTWLHSVVRNNVCTINKERAKEAAKIADAEYNPVEKSRRPDNTMDLENGLLTLADSISDEVYSALLSIQPFRLSAFVLQIQGYSIEEITRIEFERGHLNRRSDDIIKNRIFWAKKDLREILIRHGIKRKVQ